MALWSERAAIGLLAHSDSVKARCLDPNKPPGTNESFSIVPSPENLPPSVIYLKLFQLLL